MPLHFLNDPHHERYQESYFEHYPHVWRHGDFIKINARGGVYIYGRSDATLNRQGVRIGTAEVYAALEAIPEVQDSLVVCIELPDGQFYMPLFVVVAQGQQFNVALQQKMTATLRDQCSPRHVPDRYYQIDAVPYTLTGKKMEIPIRRLLLGWSLANSASLDTAKNPEAFDYFVTFVNTTTDYVIPKVATNCE